MIRKSILLLTYRFAPIAGPQELRWYYLLLQMAQRGWRVTVLTSNPDAVSGPRDTSLLEEWPYSASIHHLPVKPFRRLGHERPMLEWLPAAISFGRRLAHQASVIVSSVPPNFSPHVAGALLSLLTGRTWVADYGDPWVLNPLYHASPWHRWVVMIVERMLLHIARRVILTNQETLQLYVQYSGLDKSHFVVVPCGYPGALYSSLRPEPFESFTLVYTGGFYPKLRSPETVFQALIELGNQAPRAIIAGASLDAWQGLLRHPTLMRVVHVLPHITHREAASLQKQASVLLLVGNQSPVQVPGKLYEYIGAQRPILSIQNGPDDPSAMIVRHLNRGLVVPNDPHTIAWAIADLKADWHSNRLDARFDLSERREYMWESLADVVEQVFLDAMA